MNIYALSSGRGPSGIAIVRISGKDTLSICESLTKLKNINHEYTLLMKIYEDQISINNGVNELKNKLKEINLELWKIEDEIRDCERDKSFSNIFIELARSVYFTNDKRSKVKLEINLLLNSNLVEEKSYKDYE